MSLGPRGMDVNQALGALVVVAVLFFVGLQVVGHGVIDTTLVVALLGAALTLLGVREGITLLRGKEQLIEQTMNAAERAADRDRDRDRNPDPDP